MSAHRSLIVVLILAGCATTQAQAPVQANDPALSQPEIDGRANVSKRSGVFGVDRNIDLDQEQLLACGWDPARNAAYCVDFERYLLLRQIVDH